MLNEYELVGRLLLAAFVGSIIGLERERLLWSAGLRTHMLVCVGSCLTMIVSAYGFAGVQNNPNTILDPSRVAAQVVSGIGFLGAGTILLRGEVVRGLTTAASLWTVAGIGLAVGGGLYIAAIASTVIVLGILAGIKPIENRYRNRLKTRMLRLVTKRGEFSIDVLKQAAGKRSSRVREFVVQPGPASDQDEVTIVFVRLPEVFLTEIAAALRKLPSVVSVELDTGA